MFKVSLLASLALLVGCTHETINVFTGEQDAGETRPDSGSDPDPTTHMDAGLTADGGVKDGMVETSDAVADAKVDAEVDAATMDTGTTCNPKTCPRPKNSDAVCVQNTCDFKCWNIPWMTTRFHDRCVFSYGSGPCDQDTDCYDNGVCNHADSDTCTTRCKTSGECMFAGLPNCVMGLCSR